MSGKLRAKSPAVGAAGPVAVGSLNDLLRPSIWLRHDSRPEERPLRCPRVQTVSSNRQGSEVELETYAHLQQPDAMPQMCMKRMVHGASCREYGGRR